MSALLTGLKALGAARLAALGIVGLGMIGLIALLSLRGGGDRMALLYADLDLRDSAQVVDQLTRQKIPYQIVGQGSSVLVPASDVARARLVLAKEGLPSGGSIGYEIFDRGDELGASQFQQMISRTRALEGELSRTIRALNGVRAARIHLVLPHREPFAQERQDAQASVVLTMTGTARLDQEGVQAVLNLVAAAVPGLKAPNIAIIDSRGNVLARAGQPVGLASAQTAEDARHATELRLSRAVEEMLERSLGPGRVRAEAAVEMDFDRVNETEERFDPDGQVIRSQQTTSNNTKTTEQNGTVSVSNNLPNADAGGNGTGSQEAHQDETTNYEIGKTVRTLIREQPRIQRISLAVMVDGTEERAPDGTVAWKERSPEDLARITTLVRSAIGFDEKRGDHVEVVSMRFTGIDEPAAAEPAGLLGLGLDKSDLLRLAESGLLGLLGLIAVLVVVRPMVIRLSGLAEPAEALSMDASMALASGGQLPALTGPQGSVPAGQARLAQSLGSRAAPAEPEDDTMINIANIDGQMRASSLRKIGELVQKHPDEALAIMRTWLSQEQH